MDHYTHINSFLFHNCNSKIEMYINSFFKRNNIKDIDTFFTISLINAYNFRGEKMYIQTFVVNKLLFIHFLNSFN
jgi:hypothetical protein